MYLPVCLHTVNINFDNWEVRDFNGILILLVSWLEECIMVPTSVGWVLQGTNKLLELNSTSLTYIDLNTGELICSSF